MTRVLSRSAATGEIRELDAEESGAAAVAASCERAAASMPELVDPQRRVDLLRALAEGLCEGIDGLVTEAHRETALDDARLRGEVERTAVQLRAFADAVESGSVFGVMIDYGFPELRRILLPIGPVAVFAASNFPFAFSVLGGDTASALAAGCPVVVKVHPSHAATSLAVADVVHAAARRTGVSPDVVQLVFGFEAGVLLVQDPRIEAVGFTGSVRGGRALLDLIAERPNPVPFYGELGSLNPLVVTEGAARERGAAIGQGIADSLLMGGGQLCTKPGILFLPASPAGDAVRDAVGSAVHRASSVVPIDAHIAAGFASGVTELRESFSVLAEGSTGPDPAMRPVLLGVPPARVAELEEVFGPAACVVQYHDEEELLAALGRLRGCLAAALHTAAAEERLRGLLTSALLPRTGRLVFDGYPTGVAVSQAQHHGGPWPSSTSTHTSVGVTAVRRFQRPVVFQNAPVDVLPGLLARGGG